MDAPMFQLKVDLTVIVHFLRAAAGVRTFYFQVDPSGGLYPAHHHVFTGAILRCYFSGGWRYTQAMRKGNEKHAFDIMLIFSYHCKRLNQR